MSVQAQSFACVVRAWQSHERELLRYLARRMAGQGAAEDVLQEVFVKAMREGAGFCAIGQPRAWLFQVARTTLIDHVRRAKPTVECPNDLPAIDPDERAPVDELDACLARNLAELSAADRDILRACDLKNQTVRDFAARNRLGLAAAKSRLLRARRRLRDALVQNCRVRFDESGKVCCHVPRDPA